MQHQRTVRSVTLEFLRAGPPHNQLLSPLTPYLAICGEAGATVVHVEWEHAAFERRLEELRYEEGAAESPARRLAIVEQTGLQVARLLGSVPALSGVLSFDKEAEVSELTHLRLVLSASELGLVPYELSKIPSGLEMPADNWMLLQSQVPTCLTRHIRSVPYVRKWPTEPRILFVAADTDPDELPFDYHKQVLIDAVSPWLKPEEEEPKEDSDGKSEHYGDILTILPDATMEDVRALCSRTIYTHIHVLAHGGEDDEADRVAYGIGLGGRIVRGDQFATAISRSSADYDHRPCTVSLAVCDGANIGSVVAAGASFAHSLHQSGIPLVIAAQFPLSFEGSVTALRRMFGGRDGLLWGGNPLFMLHELRRELFVEHQHESHDWASLVIYEALPPVHELEEHLALYHYSQAKRALRCAESRGWRGLERDGNGSKQEIEKISYDTLVQALRVGALRCRTAREALPESGPFSLEARHFKARNFKAQAEWNFLVAQKRELDEYQRLTSLGYCYRHLENALDEYVTAVSRYIVGARTVQFQDPNALHWIIVQMMGMSTVLGRPIERAYWGVGELSARECLNIDDRDQRAWANASLAELYLLRLANNSFAEKEQSREVREKARGHLRAMARLFDTKGSFPIYSTFFQFQRYQWWWGGERFLKYLEKEQQIDHSKWRANGCTELADELCEILEPKMWWGPPR